MIGVHPPQDPGERRAQLTGASGYQHTRVLSPSLTRGSRSNLTRRQRAGQRPWRDRERSWQLPVRPGKPKHGESLSYREYTSIFNIISTRRPRPYTYYTPTRLALTPVLLRMRNRLSIRACACILHATLVLQLRESHKTVLYKQTHIPIIIHTASNIANE